jgi:hypothetical protein
MTDKTHSERPVVPQLPTCDRTSFGAAKGQQATLEAVNLHRTDSFCFDVRGLDDWPALIDLGLLISAECLVGLLVVRENLLPEVGELRGKVPGPQSEEFVARSALSREICARSPVAAR